MGDIQIISSKDKDFPIALKNISPKVEQIYVRGQLPDLARCFAIVGTRNLTDYGKAVVSDIGYQLAKSGFVIISGLAQGIDTCAHQAALQAKQKTIAVLGTGLDDSVMFPKENLSLAREITNHGCLISEYSNKTPGNKYSFPARNRIIAALSLGILVVEAKEKSGSLITANWAKKYKKRIFAIPGRIDSENSQGCNQLIKQGAILVQTADDIIQELKKPKTIF